MKTEKKKERKKLQIQIEEINRSQNLIKTQKKAKRKRNFEITSTLRRERRKALHSKVWGDLRASDSDSNKA